MDKKAKKIADSIFEIYMYTKKNGLDTTKVTDVQEALLVLDPNNSSLEHAEALLGVLEICDRMLILESNIQKTTI